MLARMLVVAALLLAGCPKGSQTKIDPPPGAGEGSGGATGGEGAGEGSGAMPAPGGEGSGAAPATPAPAGAQLGQPCDSVGCAVGECVSYRGIAGARGPALTSCEIRCDAQGGCADGRKCITIADGPGRVCR